MSKINRDFIGFARCHPLIGLENWRHLLNRSDAKREQSQFGHPRFPAPDSTFSSHWLLVGCDIHVNSDWPCDCYVVVLGHSIEKLFTELHRPPNRRNIPCPAFHSQVFRFLGPVPAASLPTATQ